MRVETVIHTVRVFNTWEQGYAVPLHDVAGVGLRREILECVEAQDGRLKRARAFYPQDWLAGPSLEGRLQGRCVEYALDADGRVTCTLEGGRAPTPDEERDLAGRLRQLDPFQGDCATLARYDGSESGRGELLPAVARQMDLVRDDRARAELAWRSDGGLATWTGRLHDVVPTVAGAFRGAGWTAGGDLHFAGEGWTRGEPDGLHLGAWLFGSLWGVGESAPRSRALWRHDYVTFQARVLGPAEGPRVPACAEVELPGPTSWLAERGLTIVPISGFAAGRHRGFDLDAFGVVRADGLVFAPAWVVANERLIRAHLRPGESPVPLVAVAAGELALLGRERAAPGSLAPLARGRARAGQVCWGFLPSSEGPAQVRRWTLSNAFGSSDEPDELALGLSGRDARYGSWLVVTSDGALLGWTPPDRGLFMLRDLLWKLDDTAKGGAPGMSGAGGIEDWSLPRTPYAEEWPRLPNDPRSWLEGEKPVRRSSGPADLLMEARDALALGRVDHAAEQMASLRERHPTYAAVLAAALPVLGLRGERIRALPRSRLDTAAELDLAVIGLPACEPVLRWAESLLDHGDPWRAHAIAVASRRRPGCDLLGLRLAARALHRAEAWRELTKLLHHGTLRRTDPTFAGWYVTALVQDGRYDEAVTAADEVVEAARDARTYELLARAHAGRGDPSAALAAARIGAERYPLDPSAHLVAATYARAAERTEESFAFAARGLELAPRDVALLLAVVHAAHRLGRTEQRDAYLARLAEVDPAAAAKARTELGLETPADGK